MAQKDYSNFIESNNNYDNDKYYDNDNNEYDYKYYYKKIDKLIHTEYIIFLTNSYVKNKYFKFFKKSLLTYFNKYNVVYLKYHNKEEILDYLEKFNNSIKLKSDSEKNIFAKLNNIKKIKLIYFLENIIEPNTLYKKTYFSQEELFMSFDNYLIKKMEYKLRTFCQIAEKLGAEEIKIKYDSQQDNKSTINVDFNVPSVAEIGATSTVNKSNNSKVDLLFKYSNYQYNLNLNKYYIIELIENENEFFISKEEFHSDIDLKFLIDARCLNLIELYNTKLIINRTNKLERKIFLKALNYGLVLGSSENTHDYVSLNISIKFIDIYSNPDCITGKNVYVYKQGFWHLVNIIKKEIQSYKINNNKKDYKEKNNKYKDHKDKNNKYDDNTDEDNTVDTKDNTDNTENNTESNTEHNTEEHNKKSITTDYNIILTNKYTLEDEIKLYSKVNNFLETQLIGLQKNQFTIDADYDKSQNLVTTYNDIIKLNYITHDLINGLYYSYFNNNLTYDNYEKFRNIIIGSNQNIKDLIFGDVDIKINKLYFILFKYNKILYYNKYIFNNIKKYTESKYDYIISILTNDSKFTSLIKYKISSCEIIKIMNNNKNIIIKSIINAYENSYMIYYGIKRYSYPNINKDAKSIINNDFDNKFADIIGSLDKTITSNKNFYNNIKENANEIKYLSNSNNTNSNYDSNSNVNSNSNRNSNTNTNSNRNSNRNSNTNSNSNNITQLKVKSVKEKRSSFPIFWKNKNDNNKIKKDNKTKKDNITYIIENVNYDTVSYDNIFITDNINNNNKKNIDTNCINSSVILHYIINKIIDEITKEIEIFYESNYSGYLIKLIANLLIKYFCIKYDRPNILNTDFFKNPAYYKSVDDLINKIKPIISEHRCRLNYIQYKIFYTWNNFQQIIKYVEINFINNDKYKITKDTSIHNKSEPSIDNKQRLSIDNKQRLSIDNRSRPSIDNKQRLSILNKSDNLNKDKDNLNKDKNISDSSLSKKYNNFIEYIKANKKQNLSKNNNGENDYVRINKIDNLSEIETSNASDIEPEDFSDELPFLTRAESLTMINSVDEVSISDRSRIRTRSLSPVGSPRSKK